MKLLSRLPDRGWSDRRPVIATLGNFDGLHRGHAAIIRLLLDRARAVDGIATVLTFDPHPQRVLFPERAPHLMLTAEQKRMVLEESGIDAAIVIPFDIKLAALSAERFVRELLVERVQVAELYVGPDFRFGRQRQGDVSLLAKLGAELGFTAHGIPPVMEGAERISASRIRQELAAGRVEQAADWLGRPFSLIGTIVHGEGRGKNLLVPTANLAPENEFLPAHGIYITRFRRGAETIPSITHLGPRPTFGDLRVAVETFLPGFSGDLYGQRIELDFLAYVREILKFDSAQELREQIDRDMQVFETYWRGRR